MLLPFFIIALIKLDATESQCPPTTESIQQLLDEAYIPGAAVVVVNTTEIIYQQGVGYHSPPISEQRQSIDPSSSIFLLASISKTFIAVAAMQMVESNLLNLDTDINQYLSPLMKIVHPHYPNVTITTRHLLSHTSGIGLNRVLQDEHYLPGDSFTQTNLGDVIQKYVSDNASWLPIPPGNITYFSNIGTCLAAFIIERLVGISFEQYVQNKILKPLGIDEKKAGYRLSNFEDNKKSLVDHYIYNASWLETYQQRMPQLNISQVSFKEHQSKR
jgi:CubicO group peptidase (beta-lactamase class C family)